MKKAKITILLYLLIVCIANGYAAAKIDSLESLLSTKLDDTIRVDVLLNLSKEHFKVNKNSQTTETYLNEAFVLAKRTNFIYGITKYWDLKGYIHRSRSEYKEALYCHFEAKDLAEKMNLAQLFPTIYNNIGVVYRRLDEYNKAIEYHLKALEYAEKFNQRLSKSMAINSIGNIYIVTNQFDDALNYFNKSLQISIEDNHILSQAINYNNIGEVYEFTGKYQKALVYYQKSLQLNEQIKNNEKGKAICFDCIGNVYKKTGELEKALEYYQKALTIDVKHGDRYFECVSYNNIGEIQTQFGEYSNAMDNLQKALEYSLEMGSKMQIMNAYRNLSVLFEKTNLHEKALEYYKKSVVYKDSVLNEDNNQNIAKLQILYDSEKQLREIEVLKKDQEIKDKDLQRQNLIIFLLVYAVALVLVISILFYRSYLIKRKSNEELLVKTEEINQKNILLEQQKSEIEAHKDEIEKQQIVVEEKNIFLEQANSIIEAKNKKITSSISYARRIQQAMLPPMSVVKSYFPDSFIFFRPKDIVSGDFYWFDKQDESIFFAAVDCTGHGVPGAFMSFVGFNLLNRALYEEKLQQPSHILNFMHSGIKSTLRKKQSNAIKDGMDIALCRYRYNSYELEFAGALNPLFIIREGNLIEFKADYNQLGEIDEDFFEPFTNNRLRVFPGDNVYIFSDGYMDQFGGKYSKKFLKKRFVKMLLEIAPLSMDEQKFEIRKRFEKWQGDNEQVDDVLIIGIKIQ